MITYAILRESDEDSWNKFIYLFRAFENSGEMRIFQWNGTDSLSEAADDIRDFLSQNITDKWQLILADGSQIYEKEEIGIFDDLIHEIPYASPRYVHLLVMGRGLFSGRTEYKISEKEIFEKIPSNCRLFYQNVDTGNEKITDAVIFRMACSVLMLARSKWYDYPLEYGCVYSMLWEINQEEARRYLNNYEQKYVQIKQELDHTVRMFGKDGNQIDYLPIFPETTVSLKKWQKLIRMKRGWFPFFAWNGETEAYSWKDRNAAAIKSLRKLQEWPVGRWDKEIAESRRFIFTDSGMKVFEERRMTAKAVEELRQRKVSCAEAIYEMGIGTEKRTVKINKILTLEEKLEEKIRTRMNKRSFWNSLIQTVGGCTLVLVIFSLFTSYVVANSVSSKGILLQLSIVAGISMLFLFGLEIYLYLQRAIERRGIQRELKKLEQLLWNDDEDYSRLLGKTILYKKYSYLEQQQDRLKKRMIEWRNNLKSHQEQLILYHNYGMVLTDALKICMDIPENSEIDFRGFDETPEESGYYDAPAISEMKTVKLKNTGAEFEIPYPFISDLEIRRYRFPV